MHRNPFMTLIVAIWLCSLLALGVKAVRVHEQRADCVAAYSTSVCTGLQRPLSNVTTRTVRIG